MNQSQLNFYRRLWGQARKVLRAGGLPAAECEPERHAIHVRELGADKSSLALTNGDFDKVKAAFLAIIDGGDMDAQMDAQEQPKRRRLWALRDLLAKQGKPEAYALGIARQMQGGALSAAAELDDLGEAALDAVIVALRADRRRQGKAAAPKADCPF